MNRLWRLVFCACLTVSGQTAAADFVDPCPDLTAADDSSVVTWLRSLFPQGDDAAQVQGWGDHTYYFTNSAGRFANVNCGGNLPYEWQEMYPIGTVVRPIGQVDLPTFETARRSEAILVLTEYGHRKIVRAADLTPVEDDETYIFLDRARFATFCREEEACPGSDKSVCDDKRCRKDLHGRFGYGVAGATDGAVQNAVAAYRAVFPQVLGTQEAFPMSEAQIAEMKARLDEACAPFPARAYETGHVRTPTGQLYLTLCAKRAGGGANALTRFKIVDQAYADAVFRIGLDGSFHRRFGEASFAEQMTGWLGALSVNEVKDCGREDMRTIEGRVPAGLGLNLSAGPVTAEFGAEGALSRQVQDIAEKDDYLLSSTYFIRAIPGAADTATADDKDIWLFRVMFRSRCLNGNVDSPTSIIIHYHRLAGGMLAVDEDDLRSSYIDGWNVDAYAAVSQTNMLRDGKFWEIKQLDGYYMWRDTLRRFIEFENSATSDLLSSHPPERRATVRDFFVYLMLAAAYHHRDPRFGQL